VPGYLRGIWEKLQEQWPVSADGGGPALAEEEQPIAAPEVIAHAPEELVNPVRALSEAHVRLFANLAAEYEKIFGDLYRRVEKLENAGLVNRAPPVIPENIADALPESTRRYFEYDMPEKTDWGLVIRYTERFRRAYKKTPAGLHWMISKAMENLAKKGMRYPGLGVTRMLTQNKASLLDRPECRTYELRVQRTWRIIFNVDNRDKIIWIEVIASHNDKQFYVR
jgi:hypothetical protein